MSLVNQLSQSNNLAFVEGETERPTYGWGTIEIVSCQKIDKQVIDDPTNCGWSEVIPGHVIVNDINKEIMSGKVVPIIGWYDHRWKL